MKILTSPLQMFLATLNPFVTTCETTEFQFVTHPDFYLDGVNKFSVDRTEFENMRLFSSTPSTVALPITVEYPNTRVVLTLEYDQTDLLGLRKISAGRASPNNLSSRFRYLNVLSLVIAKVNSQTEDAVGLHRFVDELLKPYPINCTNLVMVSVSSQETQP
jgi:hypothetical protein